MNLRHQHHLLASLIASKAGVSDEEAAVFSGFSPVTISNWRYDKDFKALIRHYQGRDEPMPHPDKGARIEALGLSTLDELQARLHDDPESWTKRELLEMAELLLIKARMAEGGRAPAGGNGGVRVAISFVPAEPVPELAPKTIEHTPIYNESDPDE